MNEYYQKIEIDVPIYRGVLVVIVSNSIKLVNEEIEGIEWREKEVYAHTLLSNWEGNNGYVVILNPDCSVRKMTHGVIAHEAVHVAQFIFENHGVRHDFDNPEPFNYLVEWVTDEIYRYIKGHYLQEKIH